jgi:hypothetical protein
MNELIVAQEVDKINTLTLLPAEKRAALAEAAKYTAIPYMPITGEFIWKHILNENEYPLVESKLSQAAIEMKARINRLVDAQFSINKLTLEIEELNLDIEDARNGALTPPRQALVVAKKQLEIKQKTWQVLGHTNESETNYQEFTQWKEIIENCLALIQKNCPDIKDFRDVRYDRIRVEEMKIKVARWEAMRNAGAELTPSQQTQLGTTRHGMMPALTQQQRSAITGA